MSQKLHVQHAYNNAIGNDVEDALEAMNQRIGLLSGQYQTGMKCHQAVESLLAQVDKQARDEDNPEMSLEDRAVIKPWLVKAAQACQRIADQGAHQLERAHGEAAAYQKVVKMLAKRRERIMQLLRAQEEGAPPAGPGGLGHPGPSLKQQRQAEAAAEKSAQEGDAVAGAEAKAEITEVEAPEEPTSTPPAPRKKAARKKRKATTKKTAKKPSK